MSASPGRARRVPLYLRILIGVVLGAACGALFGEEPFLLGLRNQDLGDLGLLVIRLLKALAIPLILFAILDAVLRTEIRARSGARLILICLVNVSVAMTIGLTLVNVLRPGDAWRGHLEEMAGLAKGGITPAMGAATLSPIKNLDGYIPTSLLDPFVKNNVISVVLFALFVGIALRRVKRRQMGDGETGYRSVDAFVETVYEALATMLAWVVHAIPFAVFGVVAHVVGRTGLGVLGALWPFLGIILLGLGLHSLLYYPLVAWVVGGKTPRVYFGCGADAILAGLSTNSSLATVPLTLRCLSRMGVSDESARLSACVGTNLNNDGITLYDAMAALFLAQACGFDLTLSQQAVVVLASLMAGVGIAGIPEAGLIVLPLVLGAAGLPEAVVAAAIPLVLPVDWIIGRARSGVNVMSDMLVAILLDAGGGKARAADPPPVEEAPPLPS